MCQFKPIISRSNCPVICTLALVLKLPTWLQFVRSLPLYLGIAVITVEGDGNFGCPSKRKSE